MNYEYKLTFWDNALAQGFESTLMFAALPADYIPIKMPKNVAPGKYSGTLTVRGAGCVAEADYVFTFDVLQATQITGDLADTPICLDDNLVLIVDAIGCNLSYAWYHNNTFIEATKINYYTITNVQMEDAGEYYVVVSGDCGTATSRVAKVTANNSIDQKWDDVLYVNNADGLYDSYQWYRVIDGIKYPINGETKQYYSENPLSGTYIVEMYASGIKMAESCPFTTSIVGSPSIINIYPNPVSQDGTLTIVMDMNSEQRAGSIIEIYDMVGKQIRSKVVDGQTTSVTMQHIVPGTYVVRITSASGEVWKSEKVIVQ
jgi:hypothetical protein